MTPKQDWGAFTVVLILADALAVSLMVALDYDPVPVVLFGAVVIAVFLYIIYKRYHVEVVSESDLDEFHNFEDLRILCSIYGLQVDGEENSLRERLKEFSSTNSKHAFVWVAPNLVSRVASTLEMPPPSSAPKTENPAEDVLKRMISDSEDVSAHRLLGRREKSAPREAPIEECPVCGARAPRTGLLCDDCGADLEFYEMLSESKVGRLVISEKAEAARRKVGYGTATSGETR